MADVRVHTWPIRKADTASPDLAAGGMKAPQQGNPKKKPKLRVHTWPLKKTDPAPTPAAAPANAAPEPADEVPNPTQRDFRGIPVVVDRPRGFVQRGMGADGKEWRRVYHVDYGHVPGTKGGDGDGLDVFIGGDEEATDAHWILQRKADGTFDEYKVMLGFQDAKAAKLMYEQHIPKKFFGSMCSMSIEMMKALLGVEPVDNVSKVLDGLRAIVKSVQADMLLRTVSKEQWVDFLGTAVGKPFAGFPDFEACVSAMRADGKSEESARAICGSLQADTEKVCAACAAAKKPDDTIEKEVRLAKAELQGEMRYALGIVLEPDVVDAQGDVYSADEIRKSAWSYMVHFRNVGLMHKGLVNGKVNLVESYIAPVDMRIEGSLIKAGTWMMGLYVADDELWGKLKKGELGGLSIGGFATRTPT